MPKRKPLEASLFYRFPIIGSFLAAINARFQYKLLHFYRDAAVIDDLKRTSRDFDLKMSPLDAYALHTVVTMQADLPGVMVEVGVYNGGSAKIICSANKGRETFGYDTFDGLPKPSKSDTQWGFSWFKEGQYSTDHDTVRRSLREFPSLTLTKGIFPNTGDAIVEKGVSFAHIDVDLYQGTLDSLRFLWPRILPGGIALIHDSHARGVKDALNEFLAEASDCRAFDCGVSYRGLVKRVTTAL